MQPDKKFLQKESTICLLKCNILQLRNTHRSDGSIAEPILATLGYVSKTRTDQLQNLIVPCPQRLVLCKVLSKFIHSLLCNAAVTEYK